MKVAVIILNWNGKKLMEKFLPSLLKHTPCETAEIIVADNCSTDGSVKMLQERFPSVRVIVLDRNYGFAEGYNRAIEQVDSDYTVLLNSDVEVTPHWLDAPLDAMDRDTRIAGVQPKILSERNRSFFEYAGASGGWIDRYGYPFCRGRVLGVVEEDQGQYDTTADVFWASGACLFVRTDVYKKEGGLDSRFFAHQEEIDLCWRNNLLMIYKNLPDQDLRRVMRWRFMLDYLAAIRFVLTGHPKNAWAIVRARNVFGQWKHEYAAIRKENLEKTHAYPVPEMMKQSLLLNFYLRGMKKFSDLMQPPSSKF